MRTIICLCGCIGLLLLTTGMLKAQPTGIYMLDSNQGTYRDGNLRDLPFITGYVWRSKWQQFETAQGVYDFAAIDHIVNKLDSLNQKLTFIFSAYDVEPAYIATHAGVSTYSFTNPTNQVITARAVPYDAFLIQRFESLLDTLANHLIYSRSAGAMVAFKDHPVLANFSATIPGLGAIRNVNGNGNALHNNFSGYQRTSFIDSLVRVLEIQVQKFPTQQIFIPFYKDITDNINSPALWSTIRTRLLTKFDGVQYPKLAFWQENLAAYKDTAIDSIIGLPRTTYATPLAGLNDSAYTMFQMLQGWTTPFQDSTKTAGGTTPIDAMCYAYYTYNTHYFEVYRSDLESPTYQPMLADYNTTTSCGDTLIIVDTTTNATYISIQNEKVGFYPNPVTNQLHFTGLNQDENYLLIVYNLTGKIVVNKQVNLSVFDVSNLPSGSYFFQIFDADNNYQFKFVKL